MITSTYIRCFAASRHALCAILGVAVAACAHAATATPQAVLKAPTLQTSQVPARAPVIIGPARTTVQLTGPNVTNWGIVQRQGNKTHGKTGETLFVEGRDLNPAALSVESRLGSRAIRFQRKSGGNSARVEFTIPPDAITGDQTVLLQAVSGGATVLSEAYGICDRPQITEVTPAQLGIDITNRDANGNFIIAGNVMMLHGVCLQELQFHRRFDKEAILVGTGALTIKERFGETRFNQVAVKLDLFVPPVNSFRAAGPVRLQVPASGPGLVVDDVRALPSSDAQSSPPAPPAPLVPISIQSVESRSVWSGVPVPFVLVRPDVQNLRFVFTNQVRVKGINLTANRGTRWAIGAVDMGAANEAFPPDVTVSLPGNAPSGQVCAIRRDGQRSCASQPVTVVAVPKVTAAPPGWPLYGALDQRDVVTARVRQTLTISGFDLIPPAALSDLEARLTVSNIDVATAERCNLGLKIHRLDRSSVQFSFGTPGGSRPADCSEAEESALGLMNQAPAELALSWHYKGQLGARLQWRVRGVR